MSHDADEGGDGGDIDHGATAGEEHGSAECFGPTEQAVQVDIDDFHPVFLGGVEEDLITGEAGVIDEDVDPSGGGEDLFCSLLDGAGGGLVALDGYGAGGGEFLGLGLIAAVGEVDGGVFLAEFLDDGAADATGSARDECDLAVEVVLLVD